jgi:hypothetical protein
MDQTPRWVRYLDGEDSSYPEAALRAELETVRSKVAGMRADHRAADMSMSDDMNHLNPATLEVLIQLMLGGIPTGRDVAPLHACVRYFDPVRRRAGLPEQVGALVEGISEGEVTLQLVNLDPVEAKVGSCKVVPTPSTRSLGSAPRPVKRRWIIRTSPYAWRQARARI